MDTRIDAEMSAKTSLGKAYTLLSETKMNSSDCAEDFVFVLVQTTTQPVLKGLIRVSPSVLIAGYDILHNEQ